MSNDRTAVEKALDARRIQLGLLWREVLVRADTMAAETLRQVRAHGTKVVGAMSVARVERALELPAGSIARFEAGESLSDVLAGERDAEPPQRAREPTATPERPTRWEERDADGLLVVGRMIGGGPVWARQMVGEDEATARARIDQTLAIAESVFVGLNREANGGPGSTAA
ncbi:hypothetical protein [Allonocardiopsis opalescens]|uniref:Uncharacterized protein n=1 Tax=Allonocardiopsis opalescens TaxID=1144618 RepID=A0A2T0PVQ5_9ACTN|nr:hypothetical protein [Allonocardiopsis opalescens]PRX95614.1 hypothetical protein CLV72_109223 [Allonocardiopsis opalescens]